MPIQSGDVKLLKSAVMADVPEGGGAPTGNVIADGVSNAIFPDISELDRAGGRVNLRKTFVGIQTDDVDSYFGGNVIVAVPPQDPRVSVTLFSNGSTFDQRVAAAARIESYLNQGPEWGGYLYENHIEGQRVIQLFQRPTAELPNIGQTLVLIQNEGLAGQKLQYVRATAVSSEIRQFYDAATQRDYDAAIVTVDISDALRFDFTGSAASRSFARLSTGTKIRDTVVADAGTYVGVQPLTEAADLGDFTVKAASIYTQLVPSAQTESPITDVRTNGLSAALVPTGSPITTNISSAFTTTVNIHVGGPVYPGSLTIVRDGITLTDSGGSLVSAGVQVGLIDYDNGIASLLSNVFGTSAGTHSVTFTPAEAPELVSDQRAIPVTPESQSLSYTFVLDDIPVPRTLSISYLAQGRWYTLRDDGSGKLSGNDAAFGVGTLNYTTGSVLVTLGALPDVGSALLVQSYSKVSTVDSTNTTLLNGGRVYIPINTSSQVSESKGAKTIERNGLSVSWNDGTARTASDNGLGQITGDATGTVDYANGVIRLSPNLLPPIGTIISATITARASSTSSVTANAGNLGAINIEPGSIAFNLAVTFTYGIHPNFLPNFLTRAASALVTDDGVGGLRMLDSNNTLVNIGTVNYTTGDFTIGSGGAITVPVDDLAGPLVTFGGVFAGTGYQRTWNGTGSMGSRSRTCAFNPTQTLSVTFSGTGTSPTGDVVSVEASLFMAKVAMVPNYVLRGSRFSLGTDLYVQRADASVGRNPNVNTGVATPAGSASPLAGTVNLTAWTAGSPSLMTNWRGVLVPPSTTLEAPFMATSTTFRTAAAPLRPASLSVLGTMEDGTTFNITAGLDGKINGTRVKGRVDYQYGLIDLYFVNPSGDPGTNVDLSFLGIAGLTTIPADLVQLNTIRYNAVAFSYLPLDADILGIDPVRLPSDGRVPVFRPGGFAVVGHTATVSPATVSNGQTINCGRVRLSRVRVIGDNGVVINTGYTADLEAGTVTFTDVSGYSQPVTVEHRIEDMGVVREVQISGEVSFTRPLTHDYPAGSYVSSALIAGDLFARTSLLFDQASWNGTWSDSLQGSAATATFNSAQYPIAVTNRGALTERWLVRFTSTTAFEVIGENVGVIATGSTALNCAPLNPSTGVPYFTIPAAGWGAGWAVGNVLRFNTIGAEFPVWVVRTVQQGPETVPDDSFTLLIRGDVDQP